MSIAPGINYYVTIIVARTLFLCEFVSKDKNVFSLCKCVCMYFQLVDSNRLSLAISHHVIIVPSVCPSNYLMIIIECV